MRGTVFELPEPPIAGATEEAPHLAGGMAVIELWHGWKGFPAHSTQLALRLQESVVLIQCDATIPQTTKQIQTQSFVLSPAGLIVFLIVFSILVGSCVT